MSRPARHLPAGQPRRNSPTRPRFGVLCACAAVVAAVIAAPPAVADPGGFDLQAHRGGRGETTENSLPAFEKALQVGVSTLELDVVITADRQPLVWHDPTVVGEKCADTTPSFPDDPQFPYVGKRVHDLTLAQLRTLDCGRPLAEFPTAHVVPHNTIATLPEVFGLVAAYRADVRFNIETKVEADRPDASASPREFVEVILAAIRAADLVDRVDVQSFDWRILPLVRQTEPAIRLVALWDDATWRPGSPWLAWIDPAVVGDPLLGAKLVGADVAAPEHDTVDRPLVQRAHALGLTVIPWTVNDADAMAALIGDGVDGMITDYPTRLRRVMDGLGMALPPAYRRG